MAWSHCSQVCWNASGVPLFSSTAPQEGAVEFVRLLGLNAAAGIVFWDAVAGHDAREAQRLRRKDGDRRIAETGKAGFDQVDRVDGEIGAALPACSTRSARIFSPMW